MAVYEGVLQELSGGTTTYGIPAPSAVWVDSDGNREVRGPSSSDVIAAAATQGANMTHREFIVIGGQRIMDVRLSNRHDALLVSSLGQHVRISGLKRGTCTTVMGVRLADGTIDKIPVWMSVIMNAAYVTLPVAFLAVVGFIGLFVGNMILAFIGLGLAAILVYTVINGARRMLQARAEL